MNHREADLLKNILHFSQALRSRKVGVTIDNVMDALRGISLIDIQKKRDFYHLLKSNFVSHREEMGIFDELFEQFWSFEEKKRSLPKIAEKKAVAFEGKDETLSFEYKKERLLIKDWANGREENGLKEQKDMPVYSPEEALGQKDFGLLQKEELERVKEWVSALSRKMAMNLSRRWKKGRRGGQVDFRRSIRQSIKYGGEVMELKMKQPKPKPLRLILVCDVSGSMDIYSQFFLFFMYGLQNHFPHCETFVFSTRLSHITFLLKRREFEESLHLLSRKVLDWSGGTNIGYALHQLHHHHAGLFHPNHTLLLISSDGWDRGDTLLLDSEMRNLKRRVKRMVWLNPLLGSLNYQPLCRGMSAALPYLDHFLPCHNFLSLKNLSHLLSKM